MRWLAKSTAGLRLTGMVKVTAPLSLIQAPEALRPSSPSQTSASPSRLAAPLSPPSPPAPPSHGRNPPPPQELALFQTRPYGDGEVARAEGHTVENLSNWFQGAF